MSESLYKVVFSGRIADGNEIDIVMKNMAKLFNLDPSNERDFSKISKMFSGRRVIIKSSVDDATANKYKAAFVKAGAICDIEPEKNSAESPPEPAKPVFNERRHSQRRKLVNRRALKRTSAILPDRRKGKSRRSIDSVKDD